MSAYKCTQFISAYGHQAATGSEFVLVYNDPYTHSPHNILGLALSPEKCSAKAFSRKHFFRYPLKIHNLISPLVWQQTFFGITIDKELTWSPEIRRLTSKVSSRINIMRCLASTSWGSPSQTMNALHRPLVIGIIKYSLHVPHGISNANTKRLESLQA